MNSFYLIEFTLYDTVSGEPVEREVLVKAESTRHAIDKFLRKWDLDYCKGQAKASPDDMESFSIRCLGPADGVIDEVEFEPEIGFPVMLPEVPK